MDHAANADTPPPLNERPTPLRKRAMDLILVLTSAPLWVPALIVLMLLVRRYLGAPVFFRQPRPGKGGRVFQLVKFRTMTDERDAHGELLPDEERFTRLGRVLRATGLDELPELLNVLRGDMSLVGPRPLLVQYLPLYSPVQARRHEVLPGLTGWAQVNGRNATTWPEVFRQDVWYVDNQSLALDLRILGLTVLKLVRREGAEAQGGGSRAPFRGER